MAIELTEASRLPDHEIALATFIADLCRNTLLCARIVLDGGLIAKESLRGMIEALEGMAKVEMTKHGLTDDGRDKFRELLRSIKYDSVRGKVECL